MILPVIMAGGTGSRLWPLSRELYPKQFLTVTGNESMLQQTVARLSGIEHAAPVLICNEEHRFIAAEQMRLGGYKHGGIILEPVGRNTAPAIALAALQAVNNAKDGEEPVLLVLAADHVIENEQAFKNSVEKALPFAQGGQLVTFGIVPTAPETGYGYIRAGAQVGSSKIQVESEKIQVEGNKLQVESEKIQGASEGENGKLIAAAFVVAEFVEKPDLVTAQAYLDSGEYYWNSGMFLFKASRYLEELQKFAPEMLDVCQRAIAAPSQDLEFIRVDKSIFETCPNDSVDYAVMEKSQDVVVVPMDAGWSDVGSWSALWDVSIKDENQNVSKGDVIAVNSSNSFLHSENKLIATVGIDNLIVIETKDAILVANKDNVQDVKEIVNALKKAGRSEHKVHRDVYRPWGKFDSIDSGARDHVKRITVKPGEKLSIQKHHHRSEHWIVVSGTASVLNGDQTILVTENESTYIPLGTIHALENPGIIPLEMIEIQTGSYLGEDDIVRYEDRYGRT